MKLSDKSCESGSVQHSMPQSANQNSNGEHVQMEEGPSKFESVAAKILERITFLESELAVIKSNYEKISERITVVKVDLAVIKSNYATKEDIAKMEGILLKWFIGTAVTIAGLAFAAARFIH